MSISVKRVRGKYNFVEDVLTSAKHVGELCSFVEAVFTYVKTCRRVV